MMSKSRMVCLALSVKALEMRHSTRFVVMYSVVILLLQPRTTLAGPADTWALGDLVFARDELFPPDPGRFPLYSGLAQVADIAIYRVVPEPASATMLIALVGLLLLRRSN